MDKTQCSCREFVSLVASTAPAPGGGGAAALVGAVGAALGGMVAGLTLGKPRYEPVREQMLALKADCDRLQAALLDQVEADERGFAPLAAAYGIPRDDPNRGEALERGAENACAVPLKIMELCARAIDCMAQLAEHGARLLLSDAGCGAVCCGAALQAASLNVFVNTKMMKNRTAAEEINGKARILLEEYVPKAQAVFAGVRGRL